MSYTIAIAGKGGTGKTTVAALLIRILKEKKLGSILAVDADPNSNLAEALGVEVKETVGGILDEISSHPQNLPSGMSKDRFIEYQIQTAIAEGEGFDVLTMGRPEGPGCYCYVNNVLRNIVAKLMRDYDYVVIDNEAGLEHLSRRTTRSADALVVISDATPVGLRAAKRINDLVKELKINTRKNLLLINCCDQDIEKEKIDPVREFSNGVENLGLEYIGNVPVDSRIEKISLNGDSLMSLEDAAVSLNALRSIEFKITHSTS